MSAPTIVFVKARYIDGHLTHSPGEELPPNLFSRELISKALDEGTLRECDPAERPSLYRLFYRFTGCEEENPLTPGQLTAYTLPTNA